MNSVIKDLEDRFRSAGIVDVEGGLNFVDGYFSVAIWSLEKDEWNGNKFALFRNYLTTNERGEV
jgi:hypothetical protein